MDGVENGRRVAPAREGPIYELFAALLEYPTSSLGEQAGACRSLLASQYPEAAERLSSFVAFENDAPIEAMEEIYTRTFDLQASCCPYIGYYLFGETCHRGAFLVQLKERYRRQNLSVGNELPDHLSLVLRYLAALEGDERDPALICEGLLPVLEKMTAIFPEDNRNPYGDVLRALSLILREVSLPVEDTRSADEVVARVGQPPTSNPQPFPIIHSPRGV